MVGPQTASVDRVEETYNVLETLEYTIATEKDNVKWLDFGLDRTYSSEFYNDSRLTQFSVLCS